MTSGLGSSPLAERHDRAVGSTRLLGIEPLCLIAQIYVRVLIDPIPTVESDKCQHHPVESLGDFPNENPPSLCCLRRFAE